jgi:hypothetical protein
MKFMITGRRMGKTTRAIEELRKAPLPAAILVIHKPEAKRIQELLMGADIDSVDVVTFEDLSRMGGRKYKTIILENGEQFIHQLVHRISDVGAEVFFTATGKCVK